MTLYVHVLYCVLIHDTEAMVWHTQKRTGRIIMWKWCRWKDCWSFQTNIFLRSWWMLGLGNSNDSMTIIIISITIMTVIAKNYCLDSGHVVTGMCVWHCLASTYPQTWKKQVKMARNICDEIDLNKSWRVFCWRALRVMYGST